MKRAKFSLSHYKLLTMNQGDLVPIGLTEVLPGDTLQQATSALVRVSPLLAPVMHPVHARIHHWFVPHRLVWEDWEDFITGGPDGMDDSIFPTMNLTYTGPAPGTGSGRVGGLADFLGCPTGINGLEVSALPFRGYSLIWNEWYRDQDLQTERVIDVTSGLDTTTDATLAKSAWEKDYFTSARPWEQKGPAITIPIGTSAPVLGIGTQGTAWVAGQVVNESDGTSSTYAQSRGTSSVAPNQVWVEKAAVGDFPNVRADLQNASAVTVNVLREAMALQRYEEARARYGSRYIEYLRYLGVRSSDARLQRPEYLGGGKTTIQFSEVLQTAEGTAPVGEMRGHGIAAMRSNRYRRFFEEHGYVFTFLTIRPKTIYTYGLARHWNRRSKEDFWQRELQHIGQQEVLNKEVYAAGPSPNGTFGYQDRYDEYRRTESSIAGEFRTTLDYWHMARFFETVPALNADFVASNPTDRIYADQVSDQLYVMANHSIQARRMVARTGTSFIF